MEKPFQRDLVVQRMQNTWKPCLDPAAPGACLEWPHSPGNWTQIMRLTQITLWHVQSSCFYEDLQVAQIHISQPAAHAVVTAQENTETQISSIPI